MLWCKFYTTKRISEDLTWSESDDVLLIHTIHLIYMSRVVISDGINRSVHLLWYSCWFDGQVLAVDLRLEQRSHKPSRHIWLLLRSRGATHEWDVWTGLTQLPSPQLCSKNRPLKWESCKDGNLRTQKHQKNFSLKCSRWLWWGWFTLSLFVLSCKVCEVTPDLTAEPKTSPYTNRGSPCMIMWQDIT